MHWLEDKLKFVANILAYGKSRLLRRSENKYQDPITNPTTTREKKHPRKSIASKNMVDFKAIEDGNKGSSSDLKSETNSMIMLKTAEPKESNSG